jgi:predicted nucleic acid-binding protein
LIAVDRALLERAATLAPDALLRSLDAIHLATAQLLGADLRAVVTYDRRMLAIAGSLGLAVAAPA